MKREATFKTFHKLSGVEIFNSRVHVNFKTSERQLHGSVPPHHSLILVERYFWANEAHMTGHARI